MATLKLALLGRPQILLGDEPLSHLKSQKAQALIFYLAVTGQEQSREALAGLLWPDKTEARARNNLRVEVARLRSHLAEHLDIQRRSLRMRLDSTLVCDVRDFLAVVDSVQPTLRELQTAVTLYRSNFLEDFNLNDADLFTEWAQERRAYLHDRALDALYQITEYHSQEKQYREGIDAARRLLTLEPWLERAQRQLMWLLAKSGDRAAALAQYDSCYQLLAEELGVEPEAETTQLYKQIKSGEIGPDEDYSQTGTLIAPPFQAPPRAKNFVDRDEERDWLRQQLLASTQPVTVVGMGGLGKTTLVAAACHDLRDDLVHGVLWANVATTDPAAILEDWAQAFGYDFSRLPDVEGRAAAFQGVMEDKQALLVLDDVMSMARIRLLLPTSPTTKVLLTTRDAQLAYQISNQALELNELPLDYATELLRQVVGGERTLAEAQAAQEICELLQNLPLAIEIVAQRLRLFRRMTLAEMAMRLRDERQRLAELEGENQAVRASFALSYRALDSYEQRAFVLMGVFNGRSFTREAFAAVAEWDYFTAGDRLFSLEGASLVRMQEDGRFQQHALLADFARELLEEGEEREEGYGRFAQHYLHFAQENQHNYDGLRPEWDNMMSAMETAHNQQLWQQVIDFADALQDAWFARGRYSQARQGYKWAQNAIVRSENDKLLGSILLYWSQACIEQNDYEWAKGLLLEAYNTFQDQNDYAGVAKFHHHMARIDMHEGRYREAKKQLQASRTIYHKLEDQIGIAATLYWLARINYRLGNYDEAEQLCLEALFLQENNNDEYGVLRTLRFLSPISSQKREYLKAESYCLRALDLCEKFQDEAEYAATLYTLSIVYRRLKKYDLALNHLGRSKSLFKKMNDKRSEALASYVESMVYENLDQFDEALKCALRSWEILKTIKDDFNLVLIQLHLGDIFMHLAQPEKAAMIWTEALVIAEKQQHSQTQELYRRLQLDK